MRYLPCVVTSLICLGAAAQQPQAPPPISIGIVFDTSGSMGVELDLSRQAVAQFFKTANPQDEFFLVQSGNRPLLLSGFSSNTDEIQSLLTLAQSQGRSGLLDAIYSSVHEIRKARNPRKALLVISDGANNGSRYTESEIKSLMAEAGVPRDHIAKVLNHVEGGPAATRVYDRYAYDAEKRKALERWCQRLQAVVEGKTSKVVAMRPR